MYLKLNLPNNIQQQQKYIFFKIKTKTGTFREKTGKN